MSEQTLKFYQNDQVVTLVFKFFQDFDVFPQQRDLYFGTDKYFKDMLLILTGDRWKAIRTLATPIFTSGKLKGMTPIIESVSF